MLLPGEAGHREHQWGGPEGLELYCRCDPVENPAPTTSGFSSTYNACTSIDIAYRALVDLHSTSLPCTKEPEALFDDGDIVSSCELRSHVSKATHV